MADGDDIFHSAHAPRSFPNRKDWHEVNLPGGFQINVPNNVRDYTPFPIKNLTGVPLIRRWNQILALHELPCGIPWEIVVEAAGEAAMKLFLDLVPPGLRDIQKARLGHSYNCGFRKLFKSLRKYDPVAEGGEGARKFFLFQVEATASRVLWYYFLADAFTEFVFNWESGVIRRQECTITPLGGPCQLADAFNNVVIQDTFFPFNWHTKNNDPNNWAPGGSPWNPISAAKVAAYKTYAAATFVNNTPLAQTVTMQIADGFGNIVAGPNSVGIQPKSSATNMVYGQFNATSVAQAGALASWKISADNSQGVQATKGAFTLAIQ